MDIAKAKRLRDDLSFFSRHCLKIKTKGDAVHQANTKTEVIQPFVFSNIQMSAHNSIEYIKSCGKKVRIVFLKSRQVGLSTYTEARYFQKVFFTPGKNAFVLSEASNSTSNIFAMTKRYYTNLPEELPKPKLLKDSSDMLEFDTDSNFRIATAGSKSAGRSMTINYLHGSEVAFWDDAESLISSIFPAIPDNLDSEVILESTANGINGQGKFFFDKVYEGLDERSEWTTLFYPWYQHFEYIAPVSADFILDEEEQEIKRLYKLSDEQLAWRRARIERDYKGREHLFKQDFPICLQEAFLRSGNPLVGLQYLEAARKNVFPTANIPVVVGVDPARTGDRTVIVVRAGRKVLAIYAFDEMLETRLAGIITRVVNHFNAKRVFIDYGHGTGTYDILCAGGMSDICSLVNFGAKATNTDKYVNKRAEMYDNMRSWFMQDGGVSISGLKYEEELIADIMLYPDLEAQDSNGKLGLEKKKEITKNTGVASTDFSDALALTFASHVPFEIEKSQNDILLNTPPRRATTRWADM